MPIMRGNSSEPHKIVEKTNQLWILYNHASITVLTGLGTINLFLFPKLKTPMKGKRFAMIEVIKEKSKWKLLVIKKRISEMFRRLE